MTSLSISIWLRACGSTYALGVEIMMAYWDKVGSLGTPCVDTGSRNICR